MAEPGVVSARLALGWLIAGEWRAHPARFLLTALAIAVGVALGFAVHLINGSALASFDGAVRGVNGAADLAVRATSPLGFDERAYPRLSLAPGVADASPVVSLPAQANGARFTLLGLDAIRAAAVTPSLIGAQARGPDASTDALFDDDGLFLSRTTLAAAHAKTGDTITVAANGRRVRLRIIGLLPAVAEGQAIGVIDIAAAQESFGRLGRLDRLDLRLADAAAARAALPDLLPAGSVIASPDTVAQQGESLSRAYRVNLDMLALVALLTGGFLVYSAQSLSVARRLRAFALLRTLGLPRSGIVTAVAVEGLAIGLVGAGVGLAAGYGLASVALRWFGGDLGGGYFRGDAGLAFQPLAAAGFLGLGLAAALLGSILPARAAARAAPAAALKASGDPVDPRARVPWKPAVALLAAGGVAALLPPIAALPLFGFAGIALLLAGGIAGMPWLARRLLGPWARRNIASVPRLLAIRHLHGAPGAAATALCGMVASTALMIAMATMVTSFRGAVDEWLGEVLAADLYLRAEGGAGFDPATQARLAATPGVSALAFSRQLPLTIRADRAPLTLIARPLTGPSARLLVPVGRPIAVPPGAIAVWVSEPAQRLYGWNPGEAIRLPVAGNARFVVAGIWRDYARQAGAVVIDAAAYTRITGDATRDEAAATLAPGARADAVGRGMRARLPAGLRDAVSLAEPSTLRSFALDLFDRSFAVTYLLEAVAILVGLAGVAATISAQTVARSREFGMLRHLGVSKRQLTAMLAQEGALLGLVGAVAGVLLGGVVSQVLIHVVNPQSFNFTMETRVPVGTVLGVIAALVAAAAATAVIAGRRATAADAVLAVREDW
ncbi:FtsX-like permease family protein [Sphingomonas solaris]|uniref:FtsX-like permease family protein n=1 Tax=Alterirhizorhabdus solaris TaxID=2529389 RepID=A0A558QUJ0_9SPHN|nr:FtsX-like permease family protein [Sphingomonas solaris]TVV70727.1 FtsX-like permease family protein [Sphingomonas solaris]